MACQVQVARAQEGEKPQQNVSGSAGKSGDLEKLLNLDIDQLAKTPVVVARAARRWTLPSLPSPRKQSTVGRSAAAVFVITNEMIRRSGVTTIPEALRMAPGLDVAQVNSNTWAISSRGFNWTYGNKMLVLIDGRTVYNHDSSGMYWDVQDVVLEDVDRIEVIRGPGGTLWGANAMNGVINIITKNSKDTQGSYRWPAAARTNWGWRRPDTAAGSATTRPIACMKSISTTDQTPGARSFVPRADQRRLAAGTFRLPGRLEAWLRQGRPDHVPGRSLRRAARTTASFPFPASSSDPLTIVPCPNTSMATICSCGGATSYDDDTDWTFQTYYDNYMRSDALQTEIDRTFDVDFQYRFPVGDRHNITCGGGFRNVESYFPGGDQLGNWFPYPNETTNYTNQFVQDEIAIVEDRLTFTIGTKLEQNPYTGLEYQPTARLIWTPDHQHSLWGAISRAVRIPRASREQATISLLPQPADPFPIVPRIYGNDGVVSEAVVAYELGYREQTTDHSRGTSPRSTTFTTT